MSRRYKNLADRILSNTAKVGECWCWALACSEDGYGRISLRIPGERWPRGFWVHRVAWEVFQGPIPAGMTLDHRREEGLCLSKSCWRFEHLRLLTVQENTSVAAQYHRLQRQLQHPQRPLFERAA
jgi:hypothetical protein